MKSLSLLLSAAVLTVGNSCLAKECLGTEAQAAAAKFLGSHYSFYAEDPAKVQSVITPRFFKALELEHNCARKEPCALDGDPWLDAQEGRMSSKVEYVKERASDTDAVIAIRYNFLLSFDDTPEKQEAKLVLQRGAAGECWLIGDLISPGGTSFLDYTEKWHAENNKAGK